MKIIEDEKMDLEKKPRKKHYTRSAKEMYLDNQQDDIQDYYE